MIVALMVAAGAVLVVAGVLMLFGAGWALIAAGVALLGGAWLAEQKLRELARQAQQEA